MTQSLSFFFPPICPCSTFQPQSLVSGSFCRCSHGVCPCRIFGEHTSCSSDLSFPVLSPTGRCMSSVDSRALCINILEYVLALVSCTLTGVDPYKCCGFWGCPDPWRVIERTGCILQGAQVCLVVPFRSKWPLQGTLLKVG